MGTASASAPKAPIHRSMMVKNKLEVNPSLRLERFNKQKELEAKIKLEAEKVIEATRQAEAKQAELARVQEEVKQEKAAIRLSPSGDKVSWMRAAGIPESDWQYVDSIVSRESGWNPCAYNPGMSDCSANPTSACGLAQSLPCGKQSGYGHWTDPVANLKWQYAYVTERYGGYAGAVAFWNSHSWY